MLLPLTVVTAIVLTLAACLLFRLATVAMGITFSVCAFASWLAVAVEFFLFYEVLVERWFSRERSVIAGVWFVVSAFLAIMLTPDKHLDWITAVVSLSLFAVLFLVPYMVCMVYGKRMEEPVINWWNTNIRRKSNVCDKQIEAVLSPATSTAISQKDELAHYEQMIARLSPALVKSLPEKLQTGDALFLLVLLREDGYLNVDFLPILTKADGEISQRLYAYIADAMSAALKIKLGKWPTFEPFWHLNNGAQLTSNYKADYKDEPSEHQRRIAKLLRKAVRLRPRLDTYALKDYTRF